MTLVVPIYPTEKVNENQQTEKSSSRCQSTTICIDFEWKCRYPSFSLILSRSLSFSPDLSRCMFRRICIAFRQMLCIRPFYVHQKWCRVQKGHVRSRSLAYIAQPWHERARGLLSIGRLLVPGARARTHNNQPKYYTPIRKTRTRGKMQINRFSIRNMRVLCVRARTLRPNSVHQFLLPDFYTEKFKVSRSLPLNVVRIHKVCRRMHCSTPPRMHILGNR